MKFDITNNKSAVTLKVTFRNGYAGDYTYNFSHETGHNAYSGLVAETMNDQFSAHIKKIRKAAYNEGWEDKKKRRTKRADFDWCPNMINMERYD